MAETDTNVNSQSVLSTARSLAIEIGIIVLLTAIVLAVLNYLHVIDVGALISGSTQTQVSVAPPAKQSADVQKFNLQNVNFANNSPALFPRNLMQIANNKALHYAFAVSEFEGKISSLSASGGVESGTNMKYQVMLVLNVGSDSAKTVMLFPQEAISKINIADTNKKTLTFTDLKPGDKVIIKTNMALIRNYPYNFNEVIITKI